MKILIVYDSLFGNTEKIAQSIADSLDKVHEVQCLKLKAAEFTLFENCDLMIAGTPTHGGRPSQNWQQFLKPLPAGALKGKKAIAFDTGIPREGQKLLIRWFIGMLGYAAKRLARDLQNHGAEIAGYNTFYVEGREGPLLKGEQKRATDWISEMLLKKSEKTA